MSKTRKKLYEGMYILSTTLSEEARGKALDKILNGIAAKEGEVHKVFDQGRRKLAYEINGKRDGHYYVIYFSLPTNAMGQVWREYQLNEDLIRFMTLTAHQVPEEITFKQLIQE